MYKYIIIIPVYNESGRIKRTCEAVISFIKNRPDYLFRFIDDGSTDNTVEFIKENYSDCSQIEVLKLEQNVGKGGAVKAGMLDSEGEYACFIDGDMAYSFNHLPTLFKKLEECDVVIGSRALGFKNKKKIPVLRRILGGGFNYLSRMIIGLHFKDTQAGLKGFKMEAAKNIFEKQTISRFSFDVEVLYIAQKHGYSINEIPAIVARDHSEKNSKVNLVKDTLKMFLGLFRIHYYNLTGKYD